MFGVRVLTNLSQNSSHTCDFKIMRSLFVCLFVCLFVSRYYFPTYENDLLLCSLEDEEEEGEEDVQQQ